MKINGIFLGVLLTCIFLIGLAIGVNAFYYSVDQEHITYTYQTVFPPSIIQIAESLNGVESVTTDEFNTYIVFDKNLINQSQINSLAKLSQEFETSVLINKAGVSNAPNTNVICTRTTAGTIVGARINGAGVWQITPLDSYCLELYNTP